jgi:amino acid permease
MLRLILSIANVQGDVGEITQLTFSFTFHCSVQSIHEHMQGNKSKVEVACTAIWSAAHDTG